MQLMRIAAVLAFASLTGCVKTAAIQDQFRMADYQLPVGERYRVEMAAPVIVVGRVLAVRAVGGPKRSPGDRRIKTQLTRIQIHIEEIVRGSPVPNPIEFYFFTYSLENTTDLGVPRYIPEAGQHRIYFLRPWMNTYRSVGDVTKYTLAISSGTHAADFCRGKDPGCCIAEILLTPSPDCETESFVTDLGPATFAAGEFCSPRKAQELVEELAQSADPRIAKGATEIMPLLAQWWPGLKSPIR